MMARMRIWKGEIDLGTKGNNFQIFGQNVVHADDDGLMDLFTRRLLKLHEVLRKARGPTLLAQQLICCQITFDVIVKR